MLLASLTGPAHIAVSSAIMERVFSNLLADRSGLCHHPEETLLEMRVIQELITGPREGDPPFFDEVGATGNPENPPHVLTGEKKGDPVTPEILQGAAEPAHVFRRQPQKGIVEEKEPRAAHEPAGDGEHPLLSTAQSSGRAGPLLCQDGEESKDERELLRLPISCGVGSHLKVLENAHEGKDPHSFRNIDKPPPHHLVGRKTLDGLT